MENNIKVARAHQALSWLYWVLSIVFFALFAFAWAGEAPANLLAVSFALPFLAIGIGAIHRAVASGARLGKAGARLASLALGTLMLFSFPIGTIIGVYLLIITANWTIAQAPVKQTV